LELDFFHIVKGQVLFFTSFLHKVQKFIELRQAIRSQPVGWIQGRPARVKHVM